MKAGRAASTSMSIFERGLRLTIADAGHVEALIALELLDRGFQLFLVLFIRGTEAIAEVYEPYLLSSLCFDRIEFANQNGDVKVEYADFALLSTVRNDLRHQPVTIGDEMVSLSTCSLRCTRCWQSDRRQHS